VPGAYTAVLQDKDGETGVGLIEAYQLGGDAGAGVDMNPPPAPTPSATPLPTPVSGPVVHEINPKSVVGSDVQQEFTLSGAGFVIDSIAQVSSSETGFAFVSAPNGSFALGPNVLTFGLTTGTTSGTWQVRVRNGDGSVSNIVTFNVAAP
jgi:hypothetical protein